jgi:hypothetical protein
VTLSAGEAAALRNLARKQAGEAVDWINIADARALTALGLAERSRGGWEITAAGKSLAAAQDMAAGQDTAAAQDNVVSPMVDPHGS